MDASQSVGDFLGWEVSEFGYDVFWHVFIAFHLEFDGFEYSKVFEFKFTIDSNSNISGRHDQKRLGRNSFKDFLARPTYSIFLYEG